MTRFARTWNGVEAPQASAGLGVVGIEESANTGLAAADADDDLAVDRERRRRDRIAEGVVGDRDVPPHAARQRVERHEMRVHGADVHTIVQQCHAAIDRTEADRAHVSWHGWLVAPERPPGAKVQCGDAAACLGDVHHAVGDERRRFDLTGLLDLVYPLRSQSGYVRGSDFGQRRIAVAGVTARIGEPRCRLAVGGAETRVGHLRAGVRGDGRAQQREQRSARDAHRVTCNVIRNATRSSSARPSRLSR